MTIEQYSDFQRLIGKFDGVGVALPSEAQDYYLNFTELEAIALSLKPEVKE